MPKQYKLTKLNRVEIDGQLSEFSLFDLVKSGELSPPEAQKILGEWRDDRLEEQHRQLQQDMKIAGQKSASLLSATGKSMEETEEKHLKELAAHAATTRRLKNSLAAHGETTAKLTAERAAHQETKAKLAKAEAPEPQQAKSAG